MLHSIAQLCVREPRRVIVVALLIMVGAGIFGVPVVNSLLAGGFQDSSSESWRAGRVLAEKFRQGDMQMVITVSSPDGVQGEAAHAVGTDIVRQFLASPYVTQVTSAWTAPPPAQPDLVSKDGKTGLIIVGLSGGETGAQKHAEELAARLLHDRNGVTVKAGGLAMLGVQINKQTEKDLLLMESIAVPLSFVVLVWVFGGLLAATLPLVVTSFAVLGSMAMLRLITFATDVSIFALNLSIALWFALAIDYTLLIISRFRDEVAAGAGYDEALVRTMVTAGRSVMFSAVTVAL
jgi:RND superfamily putative drug exporter